MHYLQTVVQIVKSIDEAAGHFPYLFFVVENGILESRFLFLINVSCLQSVIRVKVKAGVLLLLWLCFCWQSACIEAAAGPKCGKGGRCVRRVPLDGLSVVSHGQHEVEFLGVRVVYDLVQFDDVGVIKSLHYFNLFVDVVKGGREILKERP